MNRPNLLSTSTLQFPNSIGWWPSRRDFPVVLLALGLFAFSPAVRAVDPPPDGGYPNQNTAEGDNALFSLTTGALNTATGFQALLNNTAGNSNTATGSYALWRNTTGVGNTATGEEALRFNTTGFSNTANGQAAL